MNSDMETVMVSIVKEEDNNIEIKEESVNESGQMDSEIKEEPVEEPDGNEQMDSEIKEEPVDEHEEMGNEGGIGDLGHFYQVECNAGPEEMQEEMEEEVQPQVAKGCPCSKDMERLESRVNRLECLLELLVSKVKSAPKVATSISTQADSKENKQLPATDNDAVIPKAATPLPVIRVATNLMAETNNRVLAAQICKEKSSPTEQSAFVKAAHSGHMRLLVSLLKSNPSKKEVGEALHMAGTPEVVKALCHVQPEIIQGTYASRAVFYAAEWGRFKVLETLLDAGANPNVVSRHTLTALHKAASKNHLKCVHTLLQKGAKVAATTSNQWTALHIAAMNGACDCIPLLLEAGAVIGAKDKSGWTPLHYAARSNHFNAVQLLLNAGASRSARNRNGKTPAELASTAKTLQLLTPQTDIQCSINTEKSDEVPAPKRPRKTPPEAPKTFTEHNYSASVPQD